MATLVSTINGDLQLNGRFTPRTLDIPSGSATNASIAASAGIETHKMLHQHRATVADPSATTTAALTKVLHVARAAGEVKEIVAGNVAPCTGNATITIDLKKNNSTVLSSTFVLDSANTARVVEAGTINPSLKDYVAGDVFEIVVTVNAGSGALGAGFFAAGTFNESPVT